MSANSASSGVRNLRAMFENKHTDQSTSPPSRGRSPNSSITSGNSRPVSKVRTSFVAVERPGDITSGQQWGLRKASDVSSMAEVRESEAVPQTSIIEAPKQPDSAKSPTSPHVAKQSIDGGLGSILKGSAFDGTPQKRPAEKKSPTKSSSPPTKKKKAPSSPRVSSKAAEPARKLQSPKEKPSASPRMTVSANSDAKPSNHSHPTPKNKASPASPRSPRLEKSSPKTSTSPATAKSMVRGGPAKMQGVMDSAKRASEGREALKKEQPKPVPKKESESEVRSVLERKTAPKPAAKTDSEKLSKPKVNGVKKEPESEVRANVNGVKKEQVGSATTKPTSPRAPTRPGKLPSAATATTAAAAAKHDPQPPKQQPARKPAPRASLPATQSRATSGTTASAAHKKSSRASLATNGNERGGSRVSLNKPDDSFMARMMRPTASSAQKTHEKVQADSPPRSKGPPYPKTPHPSKSEGAGKRMPSRSLRKSDQTESQGSKLDDVSEGHAEKDTPSKRSPGGTEDETASAGPETPHTVNGTSTATAGA